MRFEVYELGGDYWFRLTGRDCVPLLFSGPQDDLADCLERITELKAFCTKGAWFRARRSPGGAHYFTVEVSDGILATSNLYGDRRQRDVKMAFVRERLADAPAVMRGMESIARDDTNRVVVDTAARGFDTASSDRR